MKFACKHCGIEVEISQSERAKNGLKKLTDHEAECFKKHNPWIPHLNISSARPVPSKFNMNGIIEYLHFEMGRIPTEDDCLRFNMYLETDPTAEECKSFVGLLTNKR